MAPRWEVVDAASFASVRVALPAGAHVHCESDAVVTMSHGVDVKANVSGGVLQGLARSFLTSESFFTTQVRTQRTPGRQRSRAGGEGAGGPMGGAARSPTRA